MFGDAPVFPTLPCVDLNTAREFYGNTLGLAEVKYPGLGEESAELGAMYQCGQGTMLLLYVRPEPTKADNTAASWMVQDLDAVIDGLIKGGVKLEIYDLPGVEYDSRGVATMGETRGAWFKDPDGNILGLTQSM